MKRVKGEIVSSATDLANYMGCKHAVALDKKNVLEEIDKPFYHSPTLEALKERGRQHEQKYLEHLKAQGKQGISLDEDATPVIPAPTSVIPAPTSVIPALSRDPESWNPRALKRAMQQAPDFIYQAPLRQNNWRGIADFLIKTDKPGNFGDYSYEILDARLAKETRGETILQLCVYSEILAGLQGVKLIDNDILIVTPYNAQLGEISKRLPNIRVGTVDKFQGQQAPVVIVSYATSTPEEAPRGMDFLYRLNRLNVAVRRTKCTVFSFCSPALIEPECKKPGHMRLANGLARYIQCAFEARTAELGNAHAG